MRKVEMEERRKLRDVPNGEFVRIITMSSGKVQQRIYVRGDYCRDVRKFELYAYDDVCDCKYLSGDREVLVGFTY